MIKLIAALALATIAAGSATAADTSPRRFQVEAQVRDGDAEPTRPRLLVEAGKPATIQIANHLYSLRVTATPDAAAEVAIASMVTSWSPSGLVHQDRHANVSADGTPVHMSFDRTDPASGEQRRLEIELRITPAE